MSEYIDEKESEVWGVLPVEMKGLILSKPYTMVFTQDKTVFARTTSKIMHKHAKKAREKTENSGGGRLEKIKNQMGAHLSHHQKYLDMTIQEIINEHKKNFMINNQTIKKIKVRKRTIDQQGFPETEVRILIKTPGKKIKLRVNKQINNKEAMQTLKKAYGPKIK
ncbi:hypothetical protein AMET1_1266 [Methanonatronarchaeum thermophilum]|uniref:Uncharacterized protein n=1 Tax=Methanonatronarchaeum thermophilum TaxID=1927129 RepID=A0A1Y3GDG6_9EURY|nr:hypothetical protein [Methanonatronarchaeum thermophilum]OUJ18353.1 hypothetical protein AMET1_1266 [Methanonatronarchaeum thermophilum]